MDWHISNNRKSPTYMRLGRGTGGIGGRWPGGSEPLTSPSIHMLSAFASWSTYGGSDQRAPQPHKNTDFSGIACLLFSTSWFRFFFLGRNFCNEHFFMHNQAHPFVFRCSSRIFVGKKTRSSAFANCECDVQEGVSMTTSLFFFFVSTTQKALVPKGTSHCYSFVFG